MADGGVVGILGSTIIKDILLPFIFIFVLIFALLEKTNVVGEGKHQINAIISFVIGLIVIAVPQARDAITGIIPAVIVLAVVLLFFLLIVGFAGGKDKIELGKWFTVVVGIIAIATILGALLIKLNMLSFVQNLSTQSWFNTAWQTIAFIIVVVVILAIVVKSAGQQQAKKE